MQKLLISSIAIAVTLGMPLAALADSYDNFMRKQVAEFQNSNNDKCKERKIEGGVESGSKITYYLCVYKNKPVFLRTVADDTPISVSTFKGGKLVELSLWEGTGGVGFRNGEPVVEWNVGEFSKRGVNWTLNAEEKSKFQEMAAKEKRILRKFGF
jgi:hypothetical protein